MESLKQLVKDLCSFYKGQRCNQSLIANFDLCFLEIYGKRFFTRGLQLITKPEVASFGGLKKIWKSWCRI